MISEEELEKMVDEQMQMLKEMRAMLYNYDEGSKPVDQMADNHDQKMLELGIKIRGGHSDPKSILEHFQFKQQKNMRESCNHNLDTQILFSAAVLPESLAAVEEEALAEVKNHIIETRINQD